MRREVLIELRARDENVRERLEQARAHVRTLRSSANRPEEKVAAPYRSDQGAVVGKEELATAIAEESALMREREQVRRGLAEAGIHTSLPSAPTRVATPCAARWGEMDGDDRARVCARCRKRVHDVDGMSTEDIDALVSRVQSAPVLFRRADGTLVAGDCPVGLRRRRTLLAIAALGSALAIGAVSFALGRVPHVAEVVRPLPHPESPKVPGEVAEPFTVKTIALEEDKLAPGEKAYIEAAFVHPNRDKRLAAARSLLTTDGWSIWLSEDREDYATLRNEIAASKKASAVESVLEGAILGGDRAVLADAVRDAPDKQHKSWATFETRVGAIRCLLGDSAGGLAALRSADKLARADHQPFEPNDRVHAAYVGERTSTHLAAIACGAPFEPPETDPSLESDDGTLAALGYTSRTKYHPGDSFDTLVRAAPQIAQTGKLDAKMRLYVNTWRFMTPRSIFFFGSRTPVVALATLERAAQRVEPSSKDAAYYLWIAAAEERVRRGNLDGARLDVNRAETDIPASTLPLTVPVRLAIGDAHEASALIARTSPATEKDRLQLLLWSILAHIAASEWSYALFDASSFDASVRLQSSDDRQWTIIAAWLRAALSWHSGTRDLSASNARVENLTTWLTAAGSSAEARRTFRISEGHYHLATPLSNDLSASARSAVLYLTGEVAAGEGDVDVWLDALERIPAPARAYFADRAAAALWRGDEAAAKQWRERSAHWSALVHDDATAVLASVAGL